MQLNDFLYNFGYRMGQIECMSKENIDGYSFPEALQNFADKICEKQRENCEFQMKQNSIDWAYSRKIINAEQPKIEEL